MQIKRYYTYLFLHRYFSLVFGRFSLVASLMVFVITMLLVASTPSSALIAATPIVMCVTWFFIGCGLGIAAVACLRYDFVREHSDYLKSLGATTVQESAISFIMSATLLLSGIPLTLWAIFVTKLSSLLVLYIFGYVFTFVLALVIVKRIVLLTTQFPMSLQYYPIRYHTRIRAVAGATVRSMRGGLLFGLVVLFVAFATLIMIIPLSFWVVIGIIVVYFGVLFEIVTDQEGTSARDWRHYYRISVCELKTAIALTALIPSFAFLLFSSIFYFIKIQSLLAPLIAGCVVIIICYLSSMPLLNFLLRSMEQTYFISPSKWLIATSAVFFALIPLAVYSAGTIVFRQIFRKGNKC